MAHGPVSSQVPSRSMALALVWVQTLATTPESSQLRATRGSAANAVPATTEPAIPAATSARATFLPMLLAVPCSRDIAVPFLAVLRPWRLYLQNDW